MAITLSGIGGIFTRWGKLLRASNDAQNQVNGQATSDAVAINNQYLAAQQQVVGSPPTAIFPAQSTYQNSGQQWLTNLQNTMVRTATQMASDDSPGINPLNLTKALQKLINQMNVGGYGVAGSILRPTITATVTPTTSPVANTGNGTMIASLVDWDGLPLDYCLAETLKATCTNDGYPGNSGTAGSEPFTVVGQPAAASIYAYNYPQGSNASRQLITLDTTKTSGLIITDGNFENWSTNVPTSWTTILGAATITKGVSPYTGANNLVITGNGSTLTRIKQLVLLQPNTVYAMNYYAKTDGSVAAGVLAISLVNFDTEVVLNNDAGTANTVSRNVSTYTSGYVAYNGFFQTPAIMPTNAGIMIYLTTAITNTEVFQLDDIGLQVAVQAYPGGPWMGMFTGSIDWAIGDSISLAIANNNSEYTFSRQLARYFDLPGLGLKIPSASSPSISDTLITNLNAPANFAATALAGGHVTITWVDPYAGQTRLDTDSTGFTYGLYWALMIEYRVNNTGSWSIASGLNTQPVALGVQTFTDGGHTTGQHIYYRISAGIGEIPGDNSAQTPVGDYAYVDTVILA